MDKSRQVRFERIRSIDEKKLDIVIIELRKLNQTLLERRQIQTKLQSKLDEAMSGIRHKNSIVQINQAMIWANSMGMLLKDLRNHISALEEKQIALLEEVRQKRASVKGWQLLLDKIEKEQLVAIEKEAMYIADDRFLGTITLKDRSSR